MDNELLIIEYTNAITGLWEIWLTSTFAFIVGFHAGRESITRLLIWTGSLLYFAMTMVTTLRYLNYSRILAELRGFGENSGIENLGSMSYGFGISLFTLTLGTMCIGTLAAIYYAVSQYRGKKDT